MAPIPKPESRAKVKARKDRADAKALAAFRAAVWARESKSGSLGACQRCYRIVKRPEVSGSIWEVGEVHHLISRRHKATRYDPANGQLLCSACHRAVTEHRV